MKCRFCGKKLEHEFVNLGSTAISNAFLTEKDLDVAEAIYPLNVQVCSNCFLVQINEFQQRESIFTPDYVYFSSISDSWLKQCKDYADRISNRMNLGEDSLVVEVASNDGYLLQYFKGKGIDCLGIEPTLSTAKISQDKGINTVVEFFDEELAQKLTNDGIKADLLIGNNVIAHVPNLNNFVRALKVILKNNGIITLEFPHFPELINQCQFDTIYHEHFSYFSLYTISTVFEFHGMKVFDVEVLSTHGGSLRVYFKHKEDDSKEISSNVSDLLEREISAGINNLESYSGFANKILKIKYDLLTYLIDKKLAGKKIAAFGAAAKGNTFINYCGIKTDLIEYVVDETPNKQYKYLPQSHIPVFPLEVLVERKPDVIVILPWNFRDDIVEKLMFTKKWGAELVTYIPELTIE